MVEYLTRFSRRINKEIRKRWFSFELFKEFPENIVTSILGISRKTWKNIKSLPLSRYLNLRVGVSDRLQTKTNMLKRSLILSLAAVFLLSACKYKETKSAMKHGEKLKSSIEDFEDNRIKLSEKLVAGLEEAGQALSEENPDLPKVSKDFEKEWTSIQKRYDKLKGDFERVGSSSENYFAKLDELSGSIGNESLRKEELAKNAELRTKWQKTYDKASVNVNKVTEVLQQGHDFHMVLVASSIRQKLEQNVAELNNIAVQAKTLLADLEVFTQAGRELVEG